MVILCGAILLGMALLVSNLGSSNNSLPLTAEWIDEISSERYLPMARLLDTGEIEFLRSQPGYNRHMESRMRAEHLQVFRGYLRGLREDFGRICTALQVVMAHSQAERPFLAMELVQRRILFVSEMLAVELRLVLYGMGIGSVDVTALVRTFEAMRLELRQLVPMDETVCA
jgi:hypothetical protein